MPSTTDAPLFEREPVRVLSIAAGVLTAAGNCLVQVGQGSNIAIALGSSLLALAVVVGGGELARAKAWAPSSVDTIIDAEHVIASTQQG